MKLAFAFAVCGAVQIVWAWPPTWATSFLVWNGVAWLVVGVGYAAVGPRVFGKGADGRLALVHTIVLLPFLALVALIWRLGLRRGPRQGHEIVPGLWLGPRPRADGIADDVVAVLDLTAEFARSAAVGTRTYLCVPVLDGTSMSPDVIARLVRFVEECGGPVYVHCAAGNQRSATIVAAVVLARGLAEDAASAIEFVRRVRPSVRPTPDQAAALEAFARSLPRRG